VCKTLDFTIHQEMPHQEPEVKRMSRDLWSRKRIATSGQTMIE